MLLCHEALVAQIKGQIQAETQVHSSPKERRVIGPWRQTLAARLGRVGISQIRRTTAKHITSRPPHCVSMMCTQNQSSMSEPFLKKNGIVCHRENRISQIGEFSRLWSEIRDPPTPTLILQLLLKCVVIRKWCQNTLLLTYFGELGHSYRKYLFIPAIVL